eukprot:TRINITY_DN1689_c0_g1_i1.p1 TRINITY_DN1689_c0_g1~~TRINITY_DN1689_c0_g1_i1.p1  ORF type:complete len:424 (+),score=101.76 TRINITY_DN1689_c0_g1_i1:98-1273(+)
MKSESKEDLTNNGHHSKEEALSDEDLKMNAHNSEVLADQNKSIVWAIVKQLKIGESVKHLQLPTFVLQPRSLLEKLTDAFVHPEIIENLSHTPDPEQRFLSIVKFYIAGWHYRVPGVRNPLNPVIGEVFKCTWNHPDSTSVYVAEQISHHPPHSCFVYYNVDRGYIMNANVAPTYVKFHGNSAETTLEGNLKIFVYGKQFGEEVYELTYPNMAIRGILFGTLTYEVIGKINIRCVSTNYSAEVEFKQKSMFRGKYNQIAGKIKHGSKVTHTIAGFWDSQSTLTNNHTKEVTELFDNSKHKISEKRVAPKEEQAPNESRRLWEHVIAGMLKHDEEEALDAKRKIEAIQRAEQSERAEKHIEWVPKLFVKGNDNLYYYEKWNEIIEEIKQKAN